MLHHHFVFIDVIVLSASSITPMNPKFTTAHLLPIMGMWKILEEEMLHGFFNRSAWLANPFQGHKSGATIHCIFIIYFFHHAFEKCFREDLVLYNEQFITTYKLWIT